MVAGRAAGQLAAAVEGAVARLGDHLSRAPPRGGQ